MIYTDDMMLASIIRWGIKYRLYRSDWRTHNRDAVQGWGPYNGHIVHNFASDISDASSNAYLDRGDLSRGMPGPLSPFSITDDGMLWIIGWGSANHCGYMERGLHSLVLRDAVPLDRDYRPTTSQPADGSIGGGIGRVNPHYSAVEMTYGKAPTGAQLATNTRLSAALMDGAGPGYTGGSVVGHRECTTARSDPTGVPMWQHRRDVNALLKAGPAITITAPQEDDDMAMTPAERAALIADIRDAVLAAPVPRPGDASGATWPLRTALWSANTYAFQAATKSLDVDAIAAKVGAALPESSGVSQEALTAAIKAAFASLGGDVPEPPKPAA